MIEILNGALRVSDNGGVISREFHRWLGIVARAISSTYVADKAPGLSYVVGDGQFAIHGEELVLHGTEELTIEGDGVLVVL